MTYNLKVSHKAVKFAYANRSTDLDIAAATFANFAQYPLTSIVGSAGLQVTLSGGDLVLGDKIYHGFFYPSSGGNDKFEMKVRINGVDLVSSSMIRKEYYVSAPSRVENLTRSQPLFFSYSANAGDILSLRYYKQPGNIYSIYSPSSGPTSLFLMEVDK
jgi:hypothetical protein